MRGRVLYVARGLSADVCGFRRCPQTFRPFCRALFSLAKTVSFPTPGGLLIRNRRGCCLSSSHVRDDVEYVAVRHTLGAHGGDGGGNDAHAASMGPGTAGLTVMRHSSPGMSSTRRTVTLTAWRSSEMIP